MQEFITKEAKLTPEDAAKFFPLYKEMQDKQRKLFARQRELANVKPSDEQGCLNVIKESDEIDLELKRIQQNYHKRFISMLSSLFGVAIIALPSGVITASYLDELREEKNKAKEASEQDEKKTA